MQPNRITDLKDWMLGTADICVWISDERYGSEPAVHGPDGYAWPITQRLALTFIRHRRLREIDRRRDGVLYASAA